MPGNLLTPHHIAEYLNEKGSPHPSVAKLNLSGLSESALTHGAPAHFFDAPRWICAQLDSGVAKFWFKEQWSRCRLEGRKLSKHEATCVPILEVSPSAQQALERLWALVEIIDPQDQPLEQAYFREIASAVVYELYFMEQFKTSNVTVLHHLHSLIDITQYKTRAAQMAVIIDLFPQLYDVLHPVRNEVFRASSIYEVHLMTKYLNSHPLTPRPIPASTTRISVPIL